MRNIIREIYHSMLSGWHQGKGHKNTRKGNIEKALYHYKLSLKYIDHEDFTPIIIECIARTYARLNEFEEALQQAEKSLGILLKFDRPEPVIDDSILRIKRLIELLKTGNEKAIKKFIGT